MCISGIGLRRSDLVRISQLFLNYLAHLKEPYIELDYSKKTNLLTVTYDGHTCRILSNDNSYHYTHEVMDYAVYFGMEILKWLHGNRTEGCTTTAMDLAAGGGRLDIVKWLHENRTEGCTKSAMDLAAMSGHLNVVQWLHENRTEGSTEYAMNWAAANGHFEVIKWLRENRSEGNVETAISFARRYGFQEMVRWLQQVN